MDMPGKESADSAISLYRRDVRFHALVSAAVAHALEEVRGKVDPERSERGIYEAATLACMTALKQAFDGDAEITYLRSENERLRDLAFNSFQASPMRLHAKP